MGEEPSMVGIQVVEKRKDQPLHLHLCVKYVFNRNSKELTSVTCVVEVEDMLRHPSKVTKVGQSYDQVELLLFHQVCT